jgi:hypothetical protein
VNASTQHQKSPSKATQAVCEQRAQTYAENKSSDARYQFSQAQSAGAGHRLMAAMVPVAAVHEQMHQGAGHQEEVWQGCQEVTRMGRDQVEPKSCGHEAYEPAKRCSDESCPPAPLRDLGNSVRGIHGALQFYMSTFW